DEIEEKAVEVIPDYSVIGPKFKGKANLVVEKLKSSDPIKISRALDSGGFKITVDKKDYTITKEDVDIKKSKVHKGEEVETIEVENAVVLLKK
ncbi:MAG: hypothetical protein ACOC1V_05050, partial [Candidatus Saliniplasma sp.]